MHPTPTRRVLVWLVFIAALLSGCSEAVTKDSPARILMMGDSLFAWNRASGRSIADYMERSLREPVIDRSLVGARVRYALPISGSLGMNISKQFRYRDWDWVVLNGGGNDLWFGCGCVACDGKINRMVSASG